MQNGPSTNDFRIQATLQALERQRNEALNREACKDATIATLQQQLQAAAQERAALASELERVKRSSQTAGDSP